MNPPSLVYRAGRLWGRHALRHGLGYYDRRCATFALEVSGAEHVHAACRRPFLLVANHVLIRPEGMMVSQLLPTQARLKFLTYSPRLLLFNCPSDSFILRRVVREETGRSLRVVARSNEGLWSIRRSARLFQERVIHPFGNGLREGLGYLPRDHTGRFQREFLQSVEEALGRGEPILIFPGRIVPDGASWVRDSLMDGGIHPGAAHLARRYGLPILPASLSGAEGWWPGQAATVTFGPQFEGAGMSKEDLCREIVARMRALKAAVPGDGAAAPARECPTL